LSIGFAQTDSASSVQSDLILPTEGLNGASVVWHSQSPSIISDAGIVTRPNPGSSNATVSITALLTKNAFSASKTFILTVIALPTSSVPDEAQVLEAKEALSIGFAQTDSASSVQSDLILPTEGLNGTSIVWHSQSPSIISDAGIVSRPEAGQPDAYVTMEATITKNSVSDFCSFQLIVLARPASQIEIDWQIDLGNSEMEILSDYGSVAVGMPISITINQLYTSYQWFLDGTALIGETEQTISLDTTGFATRIYELVVVVVDASGRPLSSGLRFSVTR